MSYFMPVADLPISLRDQYLASLPEPQEWFLEEMVRSGNVWDLSGKGYAVFHGDTLVEFHAIDRDQAPLLLSGLAQQRPFKKGLCKSFDTVLMEAAQSLGWTMLETGYLFRKRIPARLMAKDGFRLRQARESDLAEAWETGRDFFDSIEEVQRLYCAGGLWIAFHVGQMVGSGVMIPIDGSGDVVDIGMVTRPNQRNKGIASMIVCELASNLERDGKRPICGCAESNRASKAALEKAGFVSEHRLVQMSITE